MLLYSSNFLLLLLAVVCRHVHLLLKKGNTNGQECNNCPEEPQRVSSSGFLCKNKPSNNKPLQC